MIFLFTIQGKAQWYPYTEYASCNDSIGRLSIFCDPADYAVWWSTGDTSYVISVPPGNYTAYIFNNTDSTLSSLPLTMWHDTWDLHISGFSSLYITAELPACNNIYTHPSCYPNSWSPAYITIWEDSIPVDTIMNINCTYSGYFWCCIQPGHTYDVSITDPGCGCFHATWMYTPSRSLNVPFTNIDSVPTKRFSISPNPFHTSATLTVNRQLTPDSYQDGSLQLRIFNTMGALVRHEKIPNINSYILHRGILSEGLYFYELLTPDYELIGSGKFVVE
ncbi:MAG: hypothetical protein NTV09_05590 [Bacteroidetes bacterium]|nr:hypothetical protein [Bacteroidota bacterium]